MCILLFMAPIVAPNIARFTVNQAIGGQDVANVLDMRVTNINPLESRDQALFELAGDILNNWSEHIQAFQIDDISALSVSWLDLDSLTGTRGERTQTSTYEWPRNGRNVTDAAMPAVVAARVDKATTGVRGTRGGRMYISGCVEQWSAASVTMTWDSATQDSLNGFLADFLDGINDEAGVNGRDQELVVVHTRNGAYLDYSAVSALTLNPNISTQVRRGTLR